MDGQSLTGVSHPNKLCESEDVMSNRIHKELATLKRKVKRLTKQLADLEHLVNVAIAHFPEVKYR